MSLADRLAAALGARAELLETLGADTDCVRLLHGAVEGAPGVTIDRYGPVLLVQTWRAPLAPGTLEALHRVAADVLQAELLPVWNHRARGAGPYAAWHDPDLPETLLGREHGLRFDVHPRHRGQDPLLFLDLRVGRRRIRAEAAGRSVLNLFAYTCGVGLAARAGGASEAVDVDFAASALETGRRNAALNGLEDRFQAIHFDALPVMRRLAGQRLADRRGGRRLPRPPLPARLRRGGAGPPSVGHLAVGGRRRGARLPEPLQALRPDRRARRGDPGDQPRPPGGSGRLARRAAPLRREGRPPPGRHRGAGPRCRLPLARRPPAAQAGVVPPGGLISDRRGSRWGDRRG